MTGITIRRTVAICTLAFGLACVATPAFAQSGQIKGKVSAVDASSIQALYRASQAGVQVEQTLIRAPFVRAEWADQGQGVRRRRPRRRRDGPHREPR